MDSLTNDVDKNWPMVNEQLERYEEERRCAVKRARERETQEDERDRGLAQVVHNLKDATSQLVATQSMTVKAEVDKAMERLSGILRMDNSLAIADFARSVKDLRAIFEQKMEGTVDLITGNATLQSKMTDLNKALEAKEEEMDKVEAELAENRSNCTSLKKNLQQAAAQLASTRHELQEKMQQWFQKEQDLKERLLEATKAVSSLKVNLSEQKEEHRRTCDVLKNTTEALGESMSQPDILERVPMRFISPLPAVYRQRLGQQFSTTREICFQRHSTKTCMDSNANIDGLALQELKDKYVELVDMYNEEIKSSLIDESNGKEAAESHNRLATLNLALSARCSALEADVAQLAKVERDTSQKYVKSQEEISKLKEAVELIRAQRTAHEVSLEALEKTNIDLNEQIKFLCGRVHHYQSSAPVMSEERRKRGPGTSSSNSNTEEHRVVRELAAENNKLKWERNQLKAENAELVRQLEEARKVEPVAVPQLQTKQSAESGSSLQDVSDEEDEIREPRLTTTTSPSAHWKKKWEEAKRELSDVQVQSELRTMKVNQELETAQARNNLLLHELEKIKSALSEYQVKYKALREMYENREMTIQKEFKHNGSTMRNMETVISMIAKEKDTLQKELAATKIELDRSQQRILTETQASEATQHRIVSMEVEHARELRVVESRVRQQIAQRQSEETESDSSERMKALKDFQELEKMKSVLAVDLNHRSQLSHPLVLDDRLMDLQMKLDLNQMELASKKKQTDLVERELEILKNRFEKKKAEMHVFSSQQTSRMEHLLEKKEAECDAMNLEVLRWKSASEKSSNEIQHKTKSLEQEGIRLRDNLEKQKKECRELRETKEASEAEVLKLKKQKLEEEQKNKSLADEMTELRQRKADGIQKMSPVGSLMDLHHAVVDEQTDLEETAASIQTAMNVESPPGQDLIMGMDEIQRTASENKDEEDDLPSQQPLNSTPTLDLFPGVDRSKTTETTLPEDVPEELIDMGDVPEAESTGEKVMQNVEEKPIHQIIPPSLSTAAKPDIDLLLQRGKMSLSEQVSPDAEKTDGDGQKDSDAQGPQRKKSTTGAEVEQTRRKWTYIKYEPKKKEDHDDPKKKQR